MTLRRLAALTDGRLKYDWGHTAWLAYCGAQIQCRERLNVADFNPYLRSKKPIARGHIRDLKAFC